MQFNLRTTPQMLPNNTGQSHLSDAAWLSWSKSLPCKQVILGLGLLQAWKELLHVAQSVAHWAISLRCEAI